MITSLRSLWERIRLDIIPVMEAIFPADSIACFKNKIKSGTERFDKQTKQMLTFLLSRLPVIETCFFSDKHHFILNNAEKG